MKSFSGTLQLQGNMNVEDKEICGKKKNQINMKDKKIPRWNLLNVKFKEPTHLLNSFAYTHSYLI